VDGGGTLRREQWSPSAPSREDIVADLGTVIVTLSPLLRDVIIALVRNHATTGEDLDPVRAGFKSNRHHFFAFGWISGRARRGESLDTLPPLSSATARQGAQYPNGVG